MRILLIEDDVVLAQSLTDILEDHRIHVDEAERGADALEMSSLYEYETILLDLGLPDMSGEEVLTTLRRNNNVPIMVVSGSDELEVRLSCLRLGADDFLTKPFHGHELVARVQALVRRAHGHSSNVMQFGELVLDLDARDARVDKTRVPLTNKEYEMLELLFLRGGGVVSKDNFLDHLYGGIDEPEEKIIDVFICKMRKKIEVAGAKDPVIETLWGRGYRVCADRVA